MKVYLGSDHGGFEMKEGIKGWLEERGVEVEDVGASEMIEGDDYVDYGILVAREVEKNEEDRGILFCRNGFGMLITANRFKGVRCGLGFEKDAVSRGRRDDDINCLAIPADYLSDERAKEIVKVFLEETFSEQDKYRRRLEKLEAIK